MQYAYYTEYYMSPYASMTRTLNYTIIIILTVYL